MEYAFRSTLTRSLLVFTVLALLAGVVWAQGSGEITGLVTDPQGAVVSDAQVTLINSATGDKKTTTTSGAGIYRFPALPVVGTYTLEVAPKGFKAVKISGIVASVGTTVTQDVKLELGATTEQVTVEAGAEVVQTNDSSLSQLVDRNIWENAPLQIRNQNSFIELVAGASPQDGSGSNRGAEVNGTRSGAGSYLVEGIDNNEQGQAGRGQISFFDKGGANTSISPDAIQEYRVITNGFSAEYGKGGGFVTDTVLKSGTNQWHGTLFEYNRIQALAANDWFTNQSGNEDRLVRNQFGGSIGGPIIKDKTFWYGGAEIHRARQSFPFGPFTVTTQQYLDFVTSGGLQEWAESDPNGICVQFTGSACPGAFPMSGSLGPIANTLLSSPQQHFPVSTTAVDCTTDTSGACIGRGLYTGGLQYPVPVYGSVTLPDRTTYDDARWSLKLDHRISERDQLNGVYLYHDGGGLFSEFQGGSNFIGPALLQDGNAQNAAITWNHTFTPSLLNTLKIGYTRHRLDFPSPEGTFGVPSYYTIDGLAEDFGQSTGLPQFFTDNQFQYLDTMSLVKGKHNLKFGGEYRRTRNGSSFFNGQFGFFLPWGIEDTLTDLAFTEEVEQQLYGGSYYGGAYYASAAVDLSTGRQPDLYRGYRANEFAAFINDDWRITNRLTLNVGLRWEYFGPPHNFKEGVDSNFFFGTNVTPIEQLCPASGSFVSCESLGLEANGFFPSNTRFYSGVQNGTFQVRDHEIWNKDTNNFAPRIGFAFDLFGTQKVILRAGYGVYYDRLYNNIFENIRFNPPFFSINQIGPFSNGQPVGPISTPGLLSFPFTSTPIFASGFAPVPNPRHMDQNILTAYYQQAHFGFQWEFARGWVFEPNYVGTFGTKLSGIVDINTFNGRLSCPPRDPSDPDDDYTTGPCFDNGFLNGFQTRRINPRVGSDNFRTSAFASNYHAIQLSLRKNYSFGLGLTANYTYSKALDNLSDAFLNKLGLNPTDNMNLAYDYGAADFDLRHRIVATIGYDLPFMKDNRWLGGWGVNSIVSWQTGRPFSPINGNTGYDLNKDGKFTDRLVPTAAPMDTVLSRSAQDSCDADLVAAGGAGHCYFDTAQWQNFTCPSSVNGGLWCDAPIGRNSIYGPRFANVDFQMAKKFKITESSRLTLQANFYNLFNHPNFLPPGSSGTGHNSNTSSFGASTATAGDNGGHRVTQLAIRLDF